MLGPVKPLFRHQEVEYLEHWDSPARALLWQMRTGKTKASVDRSCRLYVEGKIDGVLVLAPNGVHVNWTRRQLPEHHWPFPYRTFPWRSTPIDKEVSARELQDFLKTDEFVLPWFAVNSEALMLDRVKKAIKTFLKGRRLHLIVDESHNFRTPGSKRTKLVRALARKCPFKTILTGTPVANSPLHAFSQYEVLQPGCLGFTRFSDFKAHYAKVVIERNKSGRCYEKIDGYQNLEELKTLMAPLTSVILREDVDDMPEVVSSVRFFQPTPKQVSLYRALAKDLVSAWEEEGIELLGPEGGAKKTKMQQVMSGFIVDDFGELKDLVEDAKNPRLDAMMAELSHTGKTIIWCQFKEDIRKVARRLKENSLGYVVYYGDVNSTDRDLALDQFQNNPTITCFVGQPQAGGTGLDLSAADTVIWYSHTPDAIIREQASERATKIGGKTVNMVDVIAPGGVDEHWLSLLAEKGVVSRDVGGPGLKQVLERIASGGLEI